MAVTPFFGAYPAVGDLVHPREYEEQAGYRAYFFGHFRVFRGDQQLVDESPRRRKALMILQWFLLNPGRTCSADEFIELFWPDSPPHRALGNFHVAMHSLRRMLEPDLHSRQESAFIQRGPNNFYRFDLGERWWTDTGDVAMLFERGQACDARGERRQACYYYRRVTNYCAQGFLPDAVGDMRMPYVYRYRQIQTQSLMRLMHLHAVNQEEEDLLESAYQMLQVDRCNEPAARVVIEALLRAGHPTRAAQRLRQLWECYQRDLGVRPTRELHDLRDRITAALKGESALSSAVIQV